MFHSEILPELRLRWSKVQAIMSAEGADAMLVTTNVNLYYLSGRVFSGMIYLAAKGDPLFFVRRPISLSGDNLFYIRKPEDVINKLTELNIQLPQIIMLENDSISHNEYMRYEAIFSPKEIKNGTSALRASRAIKTDYEISLLRRSAELHTEVYNQIPFLYKKGMTDLELSIEIERASRLKGSLGLFRIFGQSMEIFMGSLLAGDNADAPSPYDFAMGGNGLNNSLPVGCNGSKLQEETSVMVDLGGNYTGYMTDMSRVFSVGQLSDIAYFAHKISLDIQDWAIENICVGIAAKDVYNKALEIATEAGLADNFMGYTQKAGFVGHGIGIEINESPVLAPRSRDIFERGMVFALEPKFVIPNVGAVGIENSFVVTDSGIEQLTLCNQEILPLLGCE